VARDATATAELFSVRPAKVAPAPVWMFWGSEIVQVLLPHRSCVPLVTVTWLLVPVIVIDGNPLGH